ncbi:MAG: metal-dependent phosphohydrolase [Acidobacteria bacterium]|nr:metal-dependent phosphohydrolase [Acidobacteriota bacterium]
MINLTQVVIDAFVDEIYASYHRAYGLLEPEFPKIVRWAGRMALEQIANTNALYHNIEHTILVTAVGKEILGGKHFKEGRVTPRDWLHVLLSLICHDIGYVGGVCRDDGDGHYTTGVGKRRIKLPQGATDASLAPYHVDRGKLFVRERFEGHSVIDADLLAANIEFTRFPVPYEGDRKKTGDYPGLVRAADLIGQLADPQYLRKHPALYREFEEIGAAREYGYNSPADLTDAYPRFYWNVVQPYVGDALRYLRVTQEGRQWIANLYSHVFAVEHAKDQHMSSSGLGSPQAIR